MAFFSGTLQEGIAAAVQQSKSVVCFVTDGEDESTQWEHELLGDANVAPLLQSEAVTLRLEAGSQEEGFLTQLYPIPKKPTVLVIKNAELKEYIVAGVTRDDFIRRLQQVLQPAQPTPGPLPASAPAPASTLAPAAPVLTPVTAPAPSYVQPSPTAADSTSSPSSGRATPPSSNENQVQSLLAERAARLAAQKKKDEEAARKRRIEKGKAREEFPNANPQNKHAEAYKKRQRDAREERERILKAIEDDKAARRARQAEKEAERRAIAAAATGEDNPAPDDATEMPFSVATPIYPTSGRLAEHCALQVRLLDGSTIRNRFSSQETLKDVRQWIDAETRSKTPYTFKILLTPLPSRTVNAAEEEGKALAALELTPSATLILVPVPKHAVSYAAAPGASVGGGGGGGGNVLTGFITYLLAFVSGFWGLVTSFFSTMFSIRGPPEPAAAARGRDPSPSLVPGAASGRDGSRLDAVRRRSEQQFYNGNSTNFQPRLDDDNDDDGDEE